MSIFNASQRRFSHSRSISHRFWRIHDKMWACTEPATGCFDVPNFYAWRKCLIVVCVWCAMSSSIPYLRANLYFCFVFKIVFFKASVVYFTEWLHFYLGWCVFAKNSITWLTVRWFYIDWIIIRNTHCRNGKIFHEATPVGSWKI